MVPIRENLVPKDKYAIKCPYTRTPTRVVIHNTANDAPAANEISYMRYNDLEISFHYAVDDVNIVQGIPENSNAWASRTQPSSPRVCSKSTAGASIR